jgi:hypothetical protein
MRTVNRLAPFGLIVLGVPVFLLLSSSSRPGTVRPATAGKSTSTLQGLALDVIDGRTVARAWVETVDGNGQKSSRTVTSADGLTWKILAGTAGVHEDAYNGRTLFVPSGSDPVIVQPQMGALEGAPVTIGLDGSLLPFLEGGLTAAGGGICAQNPNHAALFAARVDVRAVVDASVIPLSKTERLLRYQRAEYYAWDPAAGPMRITLNPDKPSEVHLTSLNPEGSPSFFPASAEARLYFTIEMLDSGVKISNPDPMVLRNPSTGWPPFQEPMINESPVSFVLNDNPAAEMMLIENQESYIYPTRELAVDVLSQQTTGNVLESTWRIRNLASTSGDVRWFFLGDVGTPLTPTRGLQTVAPGGGLEVTLRAQLHGSELTQTITLGAVTQSGARMSGEGQLRFHYPDPPLLPVCQLATSNPGPPAIITIRTEDDGSGLSAVDVLEATNATVDVPSFTPGTNEPVMVTATKLDQSQRAAVRLRVTDVAGASVICDPVIALAVRDRGRPVSETYDGLLQTEGRITVHNGRPGLTQLTASVNGTVFRVSGLGDDAETTLDVSRAMRPGPGNTVTLTAHGRPGGSATILIHD